MSVTSPELPISRVETRQSAMLVASLCLLAVALRLPNLGWGLPDIEEEALPLKKAFAMWGWSEGGLKLDPETAGWPSLSFYVHLVAQHLHYAVGRALGIFADRYDYYLLQLDMTSVVLVGRWLGILAAGVITWTGARLGATLAGPIGALLTGGLLALSPLLVANAQLITPDILLAACSALAITRIVEIGRGGSVRHYLLAGLWIGLGASCKYTPVLLVPVLYLAHLLGLRRVGTSLRWFGLDDRRLWVAALAAAVAFAATSPYVVGNWEVFRRDLSYQALHLGGGHIGQSGAPVWLYYLRDVLAPGLGWPGLLAAFVGLGWAAWRRRRAWILVSASALVYFLVLSLVSTRFDRYMLPALMPLALGPAGLWLGLRRWLRESSAWRRRLVATALVLLCFVPPALGTLAYHRERSRGSTLAQAKGYFLDSANRGVVLAMEPYGPDLPRGEQDQLRAEPVFQRLSLAQRERYLDRTFFEIVYLPFDVSRVKLSAFYYDLRHLVAYDYIVTSSAVRGRYEREPERFPRQVAFYADLERFARLERSFAPGDDARGPEIRVYRLDEAGRQRLQNARGALTPEFWRPFVADVHGPHFHAFCELVARHAALKGDFVTADLFAGALYGTTPAADRAAVLPQVGLMKLRTEDFAGARDCYTELLVLQPDDAAAEGFLGYALAQLGDEEGARLHFRRCIELGSRRPDGAKVVAWARGQLAELGDDDDLAP